MTKTEIRIELGTVPAGQTEVTFGVDLSRGFTEWLATKRFSLARHRQRHTDANPGTSLWSGNTANVRESQK